jgi:predicted DsbA family dithiol-disulfide isomerase
VPEIPVDIWFDLVCPWCYIGKRRWEAALAQFERAAAVHVRWRSFELDRHDRHGSREAVLTIPQRMQQDLGLSARQAAEGVASLTALAADVGLAYRLDETRPVNSFDAHRLLQAAIEHGLGDRVRERLMRAYTGEAADLAADAGFPAEVARALLQGDDYTDVVRADEDEALRNGVTGVPFFVIAGERRIAGAQSSHVLLEELRLAWRRATC